MEMTATTREPTETWKMRKVRKEKGLTAQEAIVIVRVRECEHTRLVESRGRQITTHRITEAVIQKDEQKIQVVLRRTKDTLM
jgi:hypothetical protein